MNIETEQYSNTPQIVYDLTTNPAKTYYEHYVSELANSPEPPVRKIHILSPNEYFQTHVNLLKYKLVDLKTIAKHYHLHVSGTKPVLVERIREYFNKHRNANHIQRVFRAHVIRLSFRLRGPAWKTRQCTNPSDFYTMEPLEEIPFERFFSYTDTHGFTYGFDIFSLLQLYKTKGELKNPYNREPFPREIVQQIATLKNITQLVFMHYVRDDWKQLYHTAVSPYAPSIHQRRRMGVQTPMRRLPVVEVRLPRPNYMRTEPEPEPETTITIPTPIPSPIQPNIQVPLLGNTENVRERVGQTQNMSLDMRVRNVFMEMDQLGNYTNTSWFLNMGTNDLISFYVRYYNLWQHRIPQEIRDCISPQRNPFNGTNILLHNPTLEQCRMICIQIIEAMVYSGINIEYRRLGALHVLSILTRVSAEAREALPWLTGIAYY
jgi:SAP domain